MEACPAAAISDLYYNEKRGKLQVNFPCLGKSEKNNFVERTVEEMWTSGRKGKKGENRRERKPAGRGEFHNSIDSVKKSFRKIHKVLINGARYAIISV